MMVSKQQCSHVHSALPSLNIQCLTHPRFPLRRRFFRWSSGDGQLFDLHPEYCYYTAPNVAESMLLAPLLNLLLFSIAHFSCCWWCPSHPSFHRQCSPPSSSPGCGGIAAGAAAAAAVLSAPLAILASEMIYDIYRNMSKCRARECLPEVRGAARVVAAAGASCVIATLEAGRIVGHWKRGGMKAIGKNLCRRFDWHCGRQDGAVKGERRRALSKVTLHVAFSIGVVTVILASKQ